VLRHLGLAVDPNPAVAARAGGSRISDAERARRAAAAEERRQAKAAKKVAAKEAKQAARSDMGRTYEISSV